MPDSASVSWYDIGMETYQFRLYPTPAQERGLTETLETARRFYNGNVRDFLNLQQSFPTNLVGKTMTLGTPGFFEIEDANERVVPRVNL